MSSLFAPDPPAPQAPSAAQQRADALAAQEQDRAETSRISTIQKQLAQETIFRNRGFGLRSLLSGIGPAKTSLLGSG